MSTISLRFLQSKANRNQPEVPEYWRPKTRADCVDGPRPCPYVGCRHHLMLDVKPTGIKMYANSPDEMDETCALDVADKGPQTLEEIGQILGMTRERVRQVEESALETVKKQTEYLQPNDRDTLSEGIPESIDLACLPTNLTYGNGPWK